MVTEAQHQALISECQKWHDELGSYKAKLTNMRNELYAYAPGKTDHDLQMSIEHFHNQFHIQLINIHDLKHEIRFHVLEANRHPEFGHRIPHHYIEEKYNTLIKDLNTLDTEFHTFLQSNA